MKQKKAAVLSSLSLILVFPLFGENVKVETGQYEPSWESLGAWECPEWFKDAKFGIWAHWGPQCHAEYGDWYARFMYATGSGQYNYHVSNFGDPAEYGWKEICRDWKAANWNPTELIELYKSAGARYFFTLGQHHDNFDLWDSPYQEWNSVNMGPKRDIVAEWAKACHDNDLPIGVSMHGSHAWTWFELAQKYDGNLTKEDGAGQWWEGYDPQELYAQQHEPSKGYLETGTIHSQWEWENGASLPSEEFKQKFLNRVLQCINAYNPDMLYFDDTVLPFYGCDDEIGLDILTHYYNHRAALNPNGEADVVVMGKILKDIHKQAMLWDVERGIPDRIQDTYWQTCTCIGEWHYNKNVYKNNSYKSAQQVIDMLVDVVSKNGNMLLSIPIKGDGTIDEYELAIVKGIKAWMDQNSCAIYGTRPWKTFGEGPLADAANPLSAQGFNEGINYSASDVRFTSKSDILYATIMRWPSAPQFTFESLGRMSPYYSGEIKSIKLLGYDGTLDYQLSDEGLTVQLPATPTNAIAPVFEIVFNKDSYTPTPLSDIISYYNDKLQNLNIGLNTGNYSHWAAEDFQEILDQAKESAKDGDETIIAEGIRKAWKKLLSEGLVKASTPATDANTDITLDKLVQKSSFKRTSDTQNGKRFGRPEYWTVENFSIPNGSDGVKEGLDKFNGRDALMLGVWNDRDKAAEDCDLANARIYRKISLPAGRYYWGANFNTVYNLGMDAYMFASDNIVDTYAIPQSAIAWAHLMEAPQGSTYWGLTFALDRPQDVYLGFQVDLTGAETQEFRAEQVILLQYNSSEIPDIADLTVRYLSEKSGFKRTEESEGTRFGTPYYWTVENLKIPCGGDGVRNGIDSYPGYNSLMLGVWNDREANTEGNIADARIYQKVSLPAGKWNFEATFQTKYGLEDNAWIFASAQPCSSKEITSKALSTFPIKNAGENDGKWYGIELNLTEPTELCLGFQADLSQGSATQEFRVKELRLISSPLSSLTAIVEGYDAPEEYYSISGIRLREAPASSFYIMRKGSTVKKIVK